MSVKVRAHVPYVGTTGYNNHTRDFLRHLHKYLPVQARNFTVGKSWTSMGEEPHNGEDYITDVDKEILYEQTLLSDQGRKDYRMYSSHGEDFTPDVHLVLNETNHHYFYDKYKGPKIGYNVWESTLQPEGFFKAWNKFDQLWVPSKWQAKCTIEQGADPNKVKVVPEGVDVNTFHPDNFEMTPDYEDGRFKFLHFGRWDYRKSTREIIETFLKTFDKDEPVDLIVSIDNIWGDRMDGCKTTEERLAKFKLDDPRIKIKHFPSREDYIRFLKNGHVFLSCARSEGWNLPLMEAMACGTPSIYSNNSGQLEFAEGKGLPVIADEERPASDNYYSNYSINLEEDHVVGNYYEPDWEDLARVMRDAYSNYDQHKERAVSEAKILHEEFNWDKVGQIGAQTIEDFLANYTYEPTPNDIEISYQRGPKVEIKGDIDKEYLVEFIDNKTQEVVHSSTIRNNMWTACGRKYYTEWIIRINGEVVDTFDLTNKRVLISLDSRSIGDTLAWAPYAVEFAKKNNCKVILSTFHNDWFKNLPAYKDIEFINPGSSTICYSIYNIGWYRGPEGKWDQYDDYPHTINTRSLQQGACDILGLDFKEVNHGVDFPKLERPIQEKYVVIGPQATAGCKEWDYINWTLLASKLSSKGYKVISLTNSPLELPYVDNVCGDLDVAANYMHHADAFVGLGSGLSWLNWALGKHTFMINGFVEDGHEFTSNVTRIYNEGACFPCWTNPNFTFDAGDWDWCPIWKGTDKQHICQKSITPDQVFEHISKKLNI